MSRQDFMQDFMHQIYLDFCIARSATMAIHVTVTKPYVEKLFKLDIAQELCTKSYLL